MTARQVAVGIVCSVYISDEVHLSTVHIHMDYSVYITCIIQFTCATPLIIESILRKFYRDRYRRFLLENVYRDR